MKVELSGILRGAARGASFVELEGQTIKALMEDLLRQYPDMAGPMDEGIAVAINGEIFRDGWQQSIPKDAE
ncbi:MAG: MoaD/ThiS family protein, partial [Pseudomonadales bacterium]